MGYQRVVVKFSAVLAFTMLMSVTAAFASSGTQNRRSTTGADFGIALSDGFRRWCPNNGSGAYCQNGGFEYHGTLKDTNSSDGDNVYTATRVEGYGWISKYGVENGTRYQAWEIYDYQAIYTNNAEWKVCRDRSFPYTDNCTTIGWVSRPY